jgi:DNA (cytosine-5)-methyltransferase 1
MRVAGLFAGIGGIELGLSRAGWSAEMLCELDAGAREILGREFDGVPLAEDVTKLRDLPATELVTAGFPCQNLSLVGNNQGIFGSQSGLVSEVFRLLERSRPAPTWLLLENVPFMLWQKKGEAIRYVTNELERLGYRWAYRIVDSRAFGLPQRRRRVLLLASKTEDPRTVLFVDDAGERLILDNGIVPCGFSWTEGRLGLGWAVNAVPTLKGGSGLGIPSPPAIWLQGEDLLVTPDIRDAERLQGFEPDWTQVAVDGTALRVGARWKLVGNAVSVPVSEWAGHRLHAPGQFDHGRTAGEWNRTVWPNAAWGERGRVYPVSITEWPRNEPYTGLAEFLEYPTKPLSAKATAGFLKRARTGSLNFTHGFLESVERHLARMESRVQEPSNVPLTFASEEGGRTRRVRPVVNQQTLLL